MDRKQLRALLAVAEHRSFSAAARSLDTVQSNISAHVARLERDLDLVLIDRATLEPTDEGRVVLERARRIETEFDALDSEIASLRDVISGHVRIGVVGTTARWLVPDVVNHLAEEFPQVHVVVLDATTSSLVLNLLNGTVDMAIVNLPVNEDELVVERLFDEDRLLIAPAGHPLHDRDTVELEELFDYELLMEAPGTEFRAFLEEAAADAGKRVRPKAEFDGMRLMASLVFSGYGAGIVPASAAPSSAGGEWRAVQINGVPGRSVGLARRKRVLPSPAQRVVGDAVRAAVSSAQGSPFGIRPVHP